MISRVLAPPSKDRDPRPRSYLIAVLAVAAVLVLRLGLAPLLGPYVPLMAFLLAVAAAARLGGARAGLVAIALSVFVGSYFFIEPQARFTVAIVPNVTRLVLFVALGAIISYFVGSAHDAEVALSRQLTHAQRLTRLQNESLKLILEHARDYAVFLTDKDGTILSWLKGAERILGWSAEEAVGKSCGIIFTQSDRASGVVEREMGVALREGMAPDKRWHVRKDGSIFFADGILAALRDEDGAVTSYWKILRDATSEHQAQEALRASEERYRLFVEVVQDYAIFMLDKNGIITSWNSGAQHLTGYSPQEIVGKHFTVFHPQELASSRSSAELLDEAVASGKFEEEGWRVRKDGSKFWATTVITPVRAEDNSLLGFGEVTRDISERKRYEDALTESLALAEEAKRELELHKKALDEAAIVAVTDIKGTITYVNDKFCAIAGYSRDELLGQNHRMINSGLHSVQFWRQMYSTIARGNVWRGEIRNRAQQGHFYWVDTVIVPFLNASGKPEQYVAIRYDITERKQYEELLHEEDRRKDEFLATLGHELRNPLAPLRNALAIMERPHNSPEILTHLREMMIRQVEQLTRLVDDLLDVSRITSGKVELKKAPNDLQSIVNRAVEMSRPFIEFRKHELFIEPAAEILMSNVDSVRITQVIANLLNNAAKYTHEGGKIWISSGRENNEAVVRVSDTGIGLAPEMLPEVFKLFTQAESDLVKSGGGLGLGLTLVKRLVEMHGGTVRARSEGLGKGSEFEVRLPLVAHSATQPATAGRDVQPMTHRRVLVVDDNVDSAESLAMLLSLNGHNVAMAHDGIKAVEVAHEFKPEVALLDIGLPGRDGYEVAKVLREEFHDGNLVLVAMTGYGQDDDKQQARAAGFDYHLTKPVEPHAVESILAKRA